MERNESYYRGYEFTWAEDIGLREKDCMVTISYSNKRVHHINVGLEKKEKWMGRPVRMEPLLKAAQDWVTSRISIKEVFQVHDLVDMVVISDVQFNNNQMIPVGQGMNVLSIPYEFDSREEAVKYINDFISGNHSLVIAKWVIIPVYKHTSIEEEKRIADAR